MTIAEVQEDSPDEMAEALHELDQAIRDEDSTRIALAQSKVRELRMKTGPVPEIDDRPTWKPDESTKQSPLGRALTDQQPRTFLMRSGITIEGTVTDILGDVFILRHGQREWTVVSIEVAAFAREVPAESGEKPAPLAP